MSSWYRSLRPIPYILVIDDRLMNFGIRIEVLANTANDRRCLVGRDGVLWAYRMHDGSCEFARFAGSLLVDETKSSYGFDAVSFITVNYASSRLNEVAIKVNQFRTSLRNLIRRRCPQVSLIGEFEVIQESEPMSYRVGIKGAEKISKVGEEPDTTHPGIEMTWIRLHLHAMAVHPGLTRDKLAKILRLVFGQHKAVRIDAIRDRVTAGGRWFNGTDRAAKYLCDKSSAVKGEQRTAIDVRAQMVAFDAYCRVTRGTRRRHGFSIGARELANVLRSIEHAREQRSQNQRAALLARLKAARRDHSLQNVLKRCDTVRSDPCIALQDAVLDGR